MKNKNNSGCIGVLIFIVFILIIILICGIIYVTNPKKVEEQINNLISYVENLASDKPQKENIILPEEEKLTEAQRYYYFQQLNEPAKKIYITIENNIDKIKNGEDNIKLPECLNEIAKSSADGKEIVAEEFQNAWDAFVIDKCEYFYLDSGKVCLVTKIISKGDNQDYEFYIGKGNNETYFVDGFDSKDGVENAIKEINNIKNEILSNATGDNYDKILYVHDWIVDNLKYDTKGTSNNSNIYGALVHKTSICEGYARLFKYLLDELSIPCVLVSGESMDSNGKIERHAWNYVYINNSWYAVDTTWDDPILLGNGKITKSIKYKYFLKGRNFMDEDHTEGGTVTKNGMRFKFPELNYKDL